MVFITPSIRPAISWGKRGIGGAPLDSHDNLNSSILFHHFSSPFEVALYAEAVVHHFALRTDSFAEVFVLTASALKVEKVRPV